MEFKSEEKELTKRPGSLGYSPNFRDSSETLDHHHHHHVNRPQHSSQPTDRRPPPEPDQILNSENKIIEPKPAGSSLNNFKPTQKPPNLYRECLKNHAATVGGNVLDGCGEFMPGGDEGSLEALKCAACGCHRNFHRREQQIQKYSESDYGRAAIHPLQLPPPLSPPPLKQHPKMHWTPMIQPVKMAFGGGAATDSSSEDLNFNGFGSNVALAPPPPPPYVLSKKRYRTKFTQDQKEKMMEFAEKVGWRIPREDDAEVQRFCAEVGVKRQVFKVWMHNNKTSVKQQQQQHHDQS